MVSYASDFTAISDMAFSNAPNVFADVQYETTYGSKTYTTLAQVRVDAVINVTTGKNLGDDFKRFIFDSTFQSPYVGQLFKWKNNYWLGVNSDNYQSLGKSLICRRCNNVLRWKDQYDNLIVEPCILNYDLGEAADYTTSQMVMSAGFIKLLCQRNENTNTIMPNKRFLFGTPNNRSAYKVYGNGRKIFLNSETDNESSPTVSEFYMGASFTNDQTDDLANGIADAYRNEFELSISGGDLIQTVGFTKTLTATVTQNGEVVSSGLTWTTDDATVCTVSGSGVINCLKIGSAKIRCKLTNNLSVYDEITVYVSNVLADDYDVVISPDSKIIYEGETQTYTCILTNNGVATGGTFTFFASGVPIENYRLQLIDGNHFGVENVKKYLSSKLSITCTSGEHVKVFDINLRGDF